MVVAKEKQYKNTGHDLSDLAQKRIDKIFDKFQTTPADAPPITSDELISGLENMPDFSGKADAPGEVEGARDWWYDRNVDDDKVDFSDMESYARYYHATVSQQPEQKVSTDVEQIAKREWINVKNKSGEDQWLYWKAAYESAAVNLPAYKQADKVVDWDALSIEWYNTDDMELSNNDIFLWFKSRLSTSGVSDWEKVIELENKILEMKINYNTLVGEFNNFIDFLDSRDSTKNIYAEFESQSKID